jgi:hypothetical protein
MEAVASDGVKALIAMQKSQQQHIASQLSLQLAEAIENFITKHTVTM